MRIFIVLSPRTHGGALSPRKLKLEYLAVMKAAAAWRESEAKNKDIPAKPHL